MAFAWACVSLFLGLRCSSCALASGFEEGGLVQRWARSNAYSLNLISRYPTSLPCIHLEEPFSVPRLLPSFPRYHFSISAILECSEDEVPLTERLFYVGQQGALTAPCLTRSHSGDEAMNYIVFAIVVMPCGPHMNTGESVETLKSNS